MGRPAAVGSGRGSGERQHSLGVAGTRQTNSHAQTTAEANVTPEAVVTAMVGAHASGGREDTPTVVKGGLWGG